MNDNLGPKPEAITEPPGAIPEEPSVPNLDPGKNPAIEDAAPDEIAEPEDTDTEATTDGASEPQKEDPA